MTDITSKTIELELPGKLKSANPENLSEIFAEFTRKTGRPISARESQNIYNELVEQNLLRVQQSSSPAENPQEPSRVKDTGKSLLAGAFGLIAIDRSGRNEIIHDLNAEHSAELFQEGQLFDKLNTLANGGSVEGETIDSVLSSLHQNSFLDREGQILQNRVKEAGGDDNVLLKIRRAVNEAITGLEKGDGQLRYTKETKEFWEKFRSVKDTKKRKQLLQERVRVLQRRSRNALFDSVSEKNSGVKKFFFPDGHLFLPKEVGKNLLKLDEKRERDKKGKEEAPGDDEKKEEKNSGRISLRDIQKLKKQLEAGQETYPWEPTPEFKLSGEDVFTKEGGIAGPRLPKINLPKFGFPGGGIAGGGEAIAPFLPEIGIALGFLLLIIIIIIIIYILLNNSGGEPFPLTQLACGNQLSQDILKSSSLIEGSAGLQGQYHIGLETDYDKGNDISEINIDVAKNMYSVVCVLFGQQVGSPYLQKTLNTFGKDIVGNYGTTTHEPLAKSIAFVAYPPTAGHNSCTITLSGNPEKDPEIIWDLWDPENCLTTNVYKFQFLVARALALSLLYQQEALMGSPDISSYLKSKFANFAQLTVSGGQTIALPTISCTNAIATQDFLRECFADMVGEYLTYPYYLDNPSIIPTPLVGSATIASQSSSASQPPLIQTPLSDFATGIYQDYFIFAFLHLFDHVDFYNKIASPLPGFYMASGGDQQVDNGSPFHAKLVLFYTDPPIHDPSGIDVSFTLPQNTIFKNDASPQGFTYTNNTLTWNFSSLAFNVGAGDTPKANANITLYPNKDNTVINGNWYVTLEGQQSVATACSSTPAGSQKDIVNAIKGTYGIELTGDLGKSSDVSRVTDIYNTLCILFNASSFQKYLDTLTANHITLSLDTQSLSCSQGASSGDISRIGWCTNGGVAFYANRFAIAHELGYQIYQRNKDSIDQKFISGVFSPAGKTLLPTGNCVLSTNPLTQKGQCFADAVAEYLVYPYYLYSDTNKDQTISFNQFNTAYTLWYNFIKQTVFGGYDYFPKQGGPH